MNAAIKNTRKQIAAAQQVEAFKAARNNFIAAKNALLNPKGDFDAAAVIDNVLAARAAMIDEGFKLAEITTNKAGKAILKDLRQRAEKSPSVMERLQNEFLFKKLD